MKKIGFLLIVLAFVYSIGLSVFYHPGLSLWESLDLYPLQWMGIGCLFVVGALLNNRD